jgi:hypothetical protein
VCLHPSVSLNNETICCEISEDKIAVCEKTAGLRCGKFSDLNSACSKVLVPIKIFQFQDMLNENRFLGTFRGHSKRPKTVSSCMSSLGQISRVKHVFKNEVLVTVISSLVFSKLYYCSTVWSNY